MTRPLPTVELLWWRGCPSTEAALARVREVLAEQGLGDAAVQLREVSSAADAQRERFVGSPTIRIGGVEVAPEPREPVALTCRVYRTRDGRVSPLPDREDIRDALREATG